MFRAVVLFCAVLTLTKGQTPVSQCLLASSGPPPINVYIRSTFDCDIQPCRLEFGRDAVFEIIFRAPYDIQRMRTTAWVYLTPIPFPYDLGENAETCNFLSKTNCPVVEDRVMRYTLTLPIEHRVIVAGPVPIEIRILDDSNSNIMCFRALVVVVAPAPPDDKLGARNSTITVDEKNVL